MCCYWNVLKVWWTDKVMSKKVFQENMNEDKCGQIFVNEETKIIGRNEGITKAIIDCYAEGNWHTG